VATLHHLQKLLGAAGESASLASPELQTRLEDFEAAMHAVAASVAQQTAAQQAGVEQQAAAQAAVAAALAGFEAVVHGRSLATPAAQAHRGG
jgi:predicted DNA-binding protein (UPF0251 family)